MGGHHEEQSFWQYMEKVIYGSVKRPKWFEPRTGTTPVLYGGYYSEIDVCIAPLSGLEHFNRYKSELKIVEAAAYSLPIIVSDTEPYTLHRDNEGVIFVKDNDWETAILSVLQMSKEEREKLGQKNYDYCFRNHNLDLINEKRINLLQTLMK
jgi:glycosyltransferase involved in cell wall biosynthesis